MGFGGGGSDIAQQQEQQQLIQQRNIKNSVAAIDKAFAGFDPNFYKSRVQAYENYALPQLGDQYRTTGKNLDYRLANQGIVNSSAGIDARGNLDKNYALKKQGVVDAATQQGQQLQQTVQGQKNALISQAQSATDPSAIAQNALATASGFSAPSTFQPIGQAFGDFSNVYLANQYANSVMPYLQGGNPMYNRNGGNAVTSPAVNNYTLN